MLKKVSMLFVLFTSIFLANCVAGLSTDYSKVKHDFSKGEVVAILGGGLSDSMQHDGWMETLIQSATKGQHLSFRNMSLSGDTVFSTPRNKDFPTYDFYLNHVKADRIFLFYGYNESFDGPGGVEKFKGQYQKLIDGFLSKKYNGKSAPKIVLFSPIAHEKLDNPNLPNGIENNKRLKLYSAAIKEVAQSKSLTYVDLFNSSQQLYLTSKKPLTLNGILPLEEGNRQLAEVISTALVGTKISADKSLEKLRQAVKDKSWHWFNRYRATDGNDIWGSRQGLSFVNGQKNGTVLMHELAMIDVMTANRDKKIWATAQDKSHIVDDSNVPAPLKVVTNVGNKDNSHHRYKRVQLNFMTPEKTANGLQVPKHYTPKVFASEKMFPEMVNPVLMNVGPKGRLWAACWTTYPKWEPLKKMDDRILILPDENGDGVADKVITFAKIHNPTGFTFWNGGVIVASQPNIYFLRDTDGDDIADEKIILLQGIDSADTHHAANHLVVGADGGLYFQSGVFFVNNIETPWRKNYLDKTSSIYRLDLNSYEFWKHANNSPNPHGISFDYWGNHFITDGTGGRGYQVRPNAKRGFRAHHFYNKKVRPVASHGIISSDHFPPEVQGNFLICNTIGFLGMKHYKPTQDTKTGIVKTRLLPDFITSKVDRNFRPTDVKFGSDGALYVSDWSNAIIGHMQHNVRDPNRDHKHGRIYRITHNKRPLQKKVKIYGQSLSKLLKVLEHPVNGLRERARAEISKHSTKDVIAATEKWMAKLDPASKDDAHHFIEALWIYQRRNVINKPLLTQMLDSPNHYARVAARTVRHYWNGNAGKFVPEKPPEPLKPLPKGIDPKITEKEWFLGQKVFKRDAHCISCHQKNGRGIPKYYPPLAKSDWVTGDQERLIKIVLNGMNGPLTVNGIKYGEIGVGAMTHFRDLLKDEEVAAVINYVRNDWGNKAPRVTPATVKKVRASLKGNTDVMTVESLKK